MEHDDLDAYVVQYTEFYLQQVGNSGSWIDQIFAEAKKHFDVNIAFSSFVRYANTFLGFFGMEHVKVMGCTPCPYERLGD
jgi:hypothetical protein